MTKEQWLEQGKTLGAAHNKCAWELGSWLVAGETAFLGVEPTSKKAKRKYFAQRKQAWANLMAEAVEATGLREQTLRTYALVVRRGVRIEPLSMAHHIEVMRCSRLTEKKKKAFDKQTAAEVLRLAKQNDWSAVEVRAEVSRRFPTGTHHVDAALKLRNMIEMIPDHDQKLKVIEELSAQLDRMKQELLHGSALMGAPSVQQSTVENGFPTYEEVAA